MNGTEMLMRSAMKALGLEPEKTMETIQQIGTIIVEFKEQLDRIERKLDIMTANKLNENGENSTSCLPINSMRMEKGE